MLTSSFRRLNQLANRKYSRLAGRPHKYKVLRPCRRCGMPITLEHLVYSEQKSSVELQLMKPTVEGPGCFGFAFGLCKGDFRV